MVLSGVVRRAPTSVLLALTLVAATASPSGAVEEAPGFAERRETAARLADEGFDLLEQRRCEEALTKFRAADDTLHSPMFVVFVARAEQCMGRLVEASDHLRGVVEEKLAEYAPDSFWQAKREAQKELAALQPRVPTWSLAIEDAAPAELNVKLDDEPLDVAGTDWPAAINPGRHRVEAEALDGRRDERDFTAAEGRNVAVTIALGTPSADGDGDGDQAEGWWTSPYLPAGVAYGVGGAGLVLGAITGALFVGRAEDLKERCPEDRCAPEDQAEGDAVSTLGTVATVGFIVAGVGAVAGTVLLLTIPGDDAQAPAVAGVRLGPGRVLLEGRF